MPQHDFILDNQPGANFRTDLNNALAALAQLSSGATAPSVTYPFMLWIDTTNSLLKIRNAANNAWIILGDPSQSRLGNQAAGNYVGFDASTGAASLPAGTTAQRPATPVSGQFRFNSSNGQFEGYNGTGWGSVGGASGNNGNAVFYENDATVSSSYTITAGKNAMTAGPISIGTGVTVTVPDNSNWIIV